MKEKSKYIVVTIESVDTLEEMLNEYGTQQYELCCVFAFQNQIVSVFELLYNVKENEND